MECSGHIMATISSLLIIQERFRNIKTLDIELEISIALTMAQPETAIARWKSRANNLIALVQIYWSFKS